MAGLVPAISIRWDNASLSGITGTSPVMTGKLKAPLPAEAIERNTLRFCARHELDGWERAAWQRPAQTHRPPPWGGGRPRCLRRATACQWDIDFADSARP